MDRRNAQALYDELQREHPEVLAKLHGELGRLYHQAAATDDPVAYVDEQVGRMADTFSMAYRVVARWKELKRKGRVAWMRRAHLEGAPPRRVSDLSLEQIVALDQANNLRNM